jgi:hypothetical protein
MYVLLFLLWSKWEISWNEYYGNFAPKITIFLVPIFLSLSSIFLFIRDKKIFLGLVLGLLGFLPIEYILFMKNYIYIDSCPCCRLFPFLNTNVHFWMNTVVILIISIAIFIYAIRKVKI